MKINHLLPLLLLWALAACGKQDEQDTAPRPLVLREVRAGSVVLHGSQSQGMPAPCDQPLQLSFSDLLDAGSLNGEHLQLLDAAQQPVAAALSLKGSQVTLQPQAPLAYRQAYTLRIGTQLRGQQSALPAELRVAFQTERPSFQLQQVQSGVQTLQGKPLDVALETPLTLTFAQAIDAASLSAQSVALYDARQQPIAATLSAQGQQITLQPAAPLNPLRPYTLKAEQTLLSQEGAALQPFQLTFYTRPSQQPLLPEVTDEELLTLVQQQTFRYFWDFAHPGSGMARERNTSGDLVTSGGSGFGLMAIIVGMERGFITKEEGMARLQKIANFLGRCERFHGAWSHWIDGNTGKAIAFSPKDDGGDLIETALLVQGLLTVKGYLQDDTPAQQALRAQIDQLWQDVEWDWYTRGQQKLYWHWSANHGWAMNLPIQGYNEGLIAYVLAASSPTHPVGEQAYHQGWARNGAQQNGKTFYGITLPLGEDFGGPLFLSQYSFLGLDPRGLQDRYADYWEQGVRHTQINRAYCLDNPKGWAAYRPDCWGLTASDNHQGYSAHSPTNDLGVITPTAALSSFPYTPAESLQALRFFYYQLGDRLWGPYGFRDAFHLEQDWFADSYLAIDQGPIVLMIENHRSGLLWESFMRNPEVQQGLKALGFSSPHLR